jgi:ABC-2 type transport system permease protein
MIGQGFAVAWLVGRRTLIKVARRPVTLVFSLVQPLFWMLFFGFLMQRYPLSELPAGLTYLSFLVPGICAMAVLFGASQAGVSLVRDAQNGFLQRMLATPAPRWALHLGKVGADGVRLVLQALAVMALGVLLGAALQWSWWPLFNGLAALLLFAVGFGSLSCIIALKARKQETLATFVHLVNMPLFFTSTALVPHKQMPDWLAAIAAWNPLTLAVESLREALLFGTAANAAFNLLPLAGLAALLASAAAIELRRGVTVSAWDVR